MGKANTTAEDVRASVGSLYADLLSKRRIEREAKEEQKRMEAELRRQKKEDKATKEDGSKMTKKEKRQQELDSWKEIVIGLTGDDLEYSSKKKGKKKYRKWINDDDGTSNISSKPKKIKKKNYNKEFEPELNMLRTLVAEQNRFTADLQRRFANAAGPATKDAMAPNKTLVELASVISSGRTNSLGMLREIGSIKKTIADLYMKQKKLDADLAGNTGMETADIGLMGSNIAASMIGGGSFMETPVNAPMGAPVFNSPEAESIPVVAQASAPIGGTQTPIIQAQSFDPDTWEGPDIGNSYAKYENIPHKYVVEKNQSTGAMRFVAIREDNGEELVGCHVPTSDPTKLKINERDMTVRGEFDEVYTLKYV